jgi:hypothetical protein
MDSDNKVPSESSKGVVVERAECVGNIEPLVDRMQVLVEGPDFDASDSGGGRASRSAGFVNLDGRRFSSAGPLAKKVNSR